MTLRRLIPRPVLLLVPTVLVLLLFAFAWTKGTNAQEHSERYRVELVNTDPYKVQTALNSLARQGWRLVSTVPRKDGTVLLIFEQQP